MFAAVMYPDVNAPLLISHVILLLFVLKPHLLIISLAIKPRV